MDEWRLRLVRADPERDGRAEDALGAIGVDLRWCEPDPPAGAAGEDHAVVDLRGRVDPPAVASVLRAAGVEVVELRRIA